ncbi:MAG: GNAT family N-acetyltransferase [Burkholderiales bacterium]
MSESRSAPATSPVSPTLSIQTHDSCPPAETAIVDNGIGEFNDAAAPLHEVAPLSCFARDPAGGVVGGAVGRRWGRCCELQQLWVAPQHRRQGIGAALVRAFEAHAQTHGCTASTWKHSAFRRQISTARSGTTASTSMLFIHTQS